VIAQGGDPVLVKLNTATPPLVEATCPGCGRRLTRAASSWSARLGGDLTARFGCLPLGDARCYQVFEVTVSTSSSVPPTEGADRG
jgi:hypothetical protein